MSIVYETELPAEPGTVFAHLTDPALLTEWWPSGADTDPVPGGEYHIWWDGPGWHLRGRYQVVDPPARLVFTWAWDHEDLPPRSVEATLTPTTDGTHLIIRHEAGSEEEGAGYQEGWEHFLGQLAGLLGEG